MRSKRITHPCSGSLTPERLERRVLLATVDWIGGASGNWDDPNNWSGGQVPSIEDDVRILGGSERPLVTLDSGDHAIRSILVQQATLNMLGGALAMADGGLFGAGAVLDVGAGMLSTDGSLAVSGNGGQMRWSGGTLGGAGALHIAGDSTLDIMGSAEKSLRADLRNDGTTTWDGGEFSIVDATFVNNGVFDALAGTIAGVGTQGDFENAGTFRQSGAGAVQFRHMRFTNSGSVEASATIRMVQLSGFHLAGGSVAGDIEVYDFGALSWTGGDMVGPGRTLVAGSAWGFITGANPKTLGRTYTASGRDVTISGSLVFNNGTLEYTDVGHRLILADATLVDGGGANLVQVTNGALETGGTVIVNVRLEARSLTPPSASSVLHLLGGGRFTDDPLYLGEVHVGGPGFDFASARGNLYFESGISSISGGSVTALHVLNAAQVTVSGTFDVQGPTIVLGTDSTLNLSGLARLSLLDIGPGARTRLAGAGDDVLRAESLILASEATLDIGRGSAIFNAAASISAAVRRGYNNGGWNGTGVTSSFAAANSSHAVGLALAGDLFTSFPATFAGQQVDADSILLTCTRYGDANLDRMVDLQDFNRLAGHFGGWRSWSGGDFDFDGRVTLRDFNRLASNFGQSALAIVERQVSSVDAEEEIGPDLTD